MSIIAGISAGVGAIGGIAGVLGSRSAAKRQQRELQKQAARNEAWYNRNYYGDYLNSAEALNAMRRVKETLAERAREARARQVISGGTPEQAIAVEEANARGVADMMSNLAARGDAYRRDIEARKQQMDAELSGQKQAIYGAQQGANASLMSAGLQAVLNGLSQFDFDGLKNPEDKV